jgi:hypothetical protein
MKMEDSLAAVVLKRLFIIIYYETAMEKYFDISKT